LRERFESPEGLPPGSSVGPPPVGNRLRSGTKVNFDHAVWDELCSLRFVDAGHNVLILGSVRVGKTFMASALGHAASRRRYSVSFQRTDVLLKRLRASRLDNSHDAELRKLIRVDLLILDDFVLQPLDPLDTADIYELIVERHRAASRC
jgi:DNA replication protein DnaC